MTTTLPEGSSPEEKQAVPAIQATLRRALDSLKRAHEVVCEYEEGSSASEAAEFIQADIAALEAALIAHARQRPAAPHAPVQAEAPISAIVMGALYDFLGMLTTQGKISTFSSSHDAAPAVEMLRRFAAKRGIPMEPALVKEWSSHLAAAPQALPPHAVQAAAQAVLDRWNSPQWEWAKQGPTAGLMAELARALAAPIPPVQEAPHAVQAVDARRGTDAQILLERELTVSAISGALAFGYEGVNPPLEECDQWLLPFWEAGQRESLMLLDAYRYRWLRDKTSERHDFYADVDRWAVSKQRRGTGQCFSGGRLDEAIDAARSSEASKQGDGNA